MLPKKLIFVLKLFGPREIDVSFQKLNLFIQLLLLSLRFSEHALVIFDHFVIGLRLNFVKVSCSDAIKFIQFKLRARIDHLLKHSFQTFNLISEPSVFGKLILGYLFQILDLTVLLDLRSYLLAFLLVILDNLGLLLEDFEGFGWWTGISTNSLKLLSFLLGIHGELICPTSLRYP